MSNDIYSQTHKVIIAGSGPAGLTAAIYAARADLQPVMFEGNQAGGQLTITTDVENYPGFPDGIMGPELIDSMRSQATRFGTTIVSETIKDVDLETRPFTLTLDSGKTLKTQALIISTGASARLMGLEAEKQLMGYGVSACATCDGFFFRGKEVLIVGGGDSAIEEATFLTKFASKVTIVHRRDELRASKIMQQRAFDNPKIAFAWNSVIEDILGVEEKKVRGVKLRNTTTDELSEMACDGVFMAIGHTPNSQFLKGKIDQDDKGYIKCQCDTSKTSVEGVFACGDVMDPHYRQAITAAGTGCRAAIDAERYLQEQTL